MKRMILASLLSFAGAAAAVPPETPGGDEATRAAEHAAQAAHEAAQGSDEAARAGAEAARSAAEATRAAAEASEFAELQTRMNELAQRMAELSAKVGDRASANALRYLADSRRGMLGIVLDDDASGARVSALTPDGPAQRAGVEVGDVITTVDGKGLRDDGTAMLAESLIAGKPVTLGVLRNGKALSLKATPERFQAADWQALARTAREAAERTFAEFDSQKFRAQLRHDVDDAMKQTVKARADIAAQWRKGLDLRGSGLFAPWWGLNLAALNPELGDYFGTERGALVLSNDARRYPGLQPGDVITRVDGHAVARPEDAMRALQAAPADKPSRLTVLRHGKPVAVELKVPPSLDLPPPIPPLPPEPAAPALPAAPAAPVAPPAPPDPSGRAAEAPVVMATPPQRGDYATP